MPMLTFKSNYFLMSVTTATEKQILARSGYWTRLTETIFQTDSLKAAVRFKKYSDDLAKEVFNHVLNQSYALPALPQLSFLDAHQIEGVKHILTRKNSYLAHAPGAGKTAQAIVASALSPCLTTVIVVPPSLTLNWEREILKFTKMLYPKSWPTISIVPTSDRQKEMHWRSDFIIVPDSMLTKEWVLENLIKLGFSYLIVDEASRFKEIESARSQALYSLTTHTYHTVFLDGSPMPNRPMELWAPAYALDPESIDCMPQQDFGMRYCGATTNNRGQWEFKHSSNEDELKERLQKRLMHVVTEDKLKHPERLRSMVFMNEDVRSIEHKSWESKHLHQLDVKDISEDASQGELAKFRRELGLRKVPWIARYVASKLDDKNESVLLFVWHREVATELAKALSKYDVAIVMGGTTNEEREDRFKRFQDGKLKCIIGNIQAMGRGHNLQKANRAIFGEFSWSAESNLQCEKRASRRGRAIDAPVRCEYVVAPGSMDEKILTSIFTKEKRVKRIIG